jgi:hypothetical protein
MMNISRSSLEQLERLEQLMGKMIILTAVRIATVAALPDPEQSAMITGAALTVVLLLEASVMAAYLQ